MSKISELSNGGALLSTDDLIVVRSGGNVRAQLSSLNGIAIGSSTPAAGSFTTLQASTSLNVDGTTTSGDITIDNDDTPTLNFKKATSADVLGTINVSTDAGSGGKMVFQTKRNGNTALDRLSIDDDGDISFLDGSGNAAVYFDSSAAALGIGTSSIDNKVNIQESALSGRSASNSN
ncbi:MAG: hypothetical protein CL581_20535, partial [Alteromonadaceae bacterium]|nr:hypothetical protein [Alteromonadaceae bacterium]